MPAMQSVARVLWFMSTAATVLLLLRLQRERLLKIYPSFSVYLAWNVVAALTLAQIPHYTKMYGILYFVFDSVRWMLNLLTALELSSSVMRRYPGIASLGRWIVGGALSVALVVALWTISFATAAPATGPGAVWINNLFLLGQVISLSVLFFVVLTVGFLSWFRVPLPANATRLFLGYALSFAIASTTYLSINTKGFRLADAVGALRMAVVLSCTLYWIVRLRRGDEASAVTIGPRPNPKREQHLVEQLGAINASLLRYLRK